MAARSTVKLSCRRPAPPGRCRCAERGAQAREQLVHAERLRDVVVGAAVERHHLVALPRASRQHDDRRAAPAAQALDHVVAVHVRQAEVQDHHVGRMARRRRERRGAVGHGGHLVVARAQVDRQRLADRALVVHHQDVGHCASGQPKPHRQAAAVRAVRDQDAVHRLREPARDREAEPGALLRAVARAHEWAGTAARAAPPGRPGRGPRPSRARRARPCARRTSTGPPPPWRIAFSSRLASTRSSSPGSALTSGRSSGTSTDTASARARHGQERRADHLVERHRHRLHAQRAGLEPAGVEQVRHDRVEPVGRLLDRGEQLARAAPPASPRRSGAACSPTP